MFHPGIYILGSHGIRLENQLLCCESGIPAFLSFEVLLCAYRPGCVALNWLDEKGRQALNAHERGFETLSPYLNEEERAWFHSITRPV